MFACCTMLTQIMLRTAVPDEPARKSLWRSWNNHQYSAYSGIDGCLRIGRSMGAASVLQGVGILLLATGILAATTLKSIRTYQ